MPAPLLDSSYVTTALGWLTSRYADPIQTPNVQGFVRALATRLQQIENDYWSFLNAVILDNHPMAGGPWAILDQIGAIVGEPRNGRTDADYVPALRLRIRINNSNGLAEDIIQIVALVVLGAAYSEWYPAAWEVDLTPTGPQSTSIVNALITDLGEAAEAGTAGNIRTQVSTKTLFLLGDSTTPGQGTGWGDSTNPTPTVRVWANLQKVA